MTTWDCLILAFAAPLFVVIVVVSLLVTNAVLGVKMKDDRDLTERFSLGAILTRMRAVTSDDVREALGEQSSENGEHLGLGEILIRKGKLTGDQLELALSAQSDLRSTDKRTRALAAAKLAEVSGRRVIQICRDVRQSTTVLSVAALAEEG